ncbi:MAG: hypothetical protein DCC71_10760 [Proteobacteria bacterium]|nr:MAG: hypothetical protein DCC71_10760 [Pseudomonadota bacterium]
MRVVAAIAACVVALVIAPRGARAEPMDLDDARARWVGVRFENSPSDRPAQLATAYTDEIAAWLEPDGATRVRVTVAGRDVERSYFSRQRLRPGSFSDYVWIFDRATGEVVSASLRGTLLREYDLGWVESEIETLFEAFMTTSAEAGFSGSKRMFGQLVFPHCDDRSDECTLVPARRYDRSTGYVNAVGSIVGRALGFSARTFSAIGEAVFSERPLSRPEGLASAR